MDASPTEPGLRDRTSLWLMTGAIAYMAASLLWYSGTPLGQVPVVDSLQQVELAKLMAEGRLPVEPFHRAPLYPWLLSLFWRLGFEQTGVFVLARLFNALCLVGAGLAASALAAEFGAGRRTRALAFTLIVANPVCLFFAGDAFDILAATAAGSWGFVVAYRWATSVDGQRRCGGALVAALCFALAAQLRSHFLPVALLWPLAVFVLADPQQRLKGILLSLLVPLAGILLFMLANHQVSGQWQPQPWQGAYNLWAGNGPYANGRYYAQVVDTGSAAPHENPAKLESLRLYEKLTGHQPPHSVGRMNRFWVSDTLRVIAADPLRWLRLMLLKTQALLHNHEQYDNKTYGLHKALSPWLRWNPLCWGLLLTGFCAAWLAGGLRGRGAWLLGALLFAYAAGILLFYPTNRFRVPLLPVLAAGTALLPVLLAKAPSRLLTWRLLPLGLLGILVFAPLGGINQDASIPQDCRILSYAALRCNQPDEAEAWARRGLRLAPADTALWNSLAVSTLHCARKPDFKLGPLPAAPENPPRAWLLLEGIRLAQAGKPGEAESLWRLLATTPGQPLAPEAEALAQTLQPATRDRFQPADPSEADNPWLLAATGRLEPGPETDSLTGALRRLTRPAGQR